MATQNENELQEKPEQVHVEATIRMQELELSEEEQPAMNFQTIMACIALSSQFNAYVFSLLISGNALSYINADLGPQNNYPWITVSWNLGAAVLVSVGGRLSDIFGRRYFMLLGSFLGFIGALLGATGQSINQMIASGVFFGIGAGFQEMSYACIQEIVPNKYRFWAVGGFDISGTISFFGPLITLAFIAHTDIGWHGAYWFIVAWEGFFFGILFIFYRPPSFSTKHRRDGKTRMELFKEMDFVGITLFVVGCTLLLLGINWGGRDFPWKSAAVITPIVLSFVILIALGFWETYADLTYPLLPPKLFKRVREFTMIIIVTFVSGMLYYSMNIIWPRMIQALFVPASEPITRGLYAECIQLGSIIAGILVIVIGTYVGHHRWQLVIFVSLQVVLIGSMTTVGVNDNKQAIGTIIALSTMVSPPNLIAFVMISLGLDDQNDIGIAVGLASTARLLGGGIATAIYTAILNNSYASTIGSKIIETIPAFPSMAALITAAKVNTAAAYASVPGITPEIIAQAGFAAKLAWVESFKLVWYVALGFGALSIVAACCTKSIDPELMNSKRAVVLENEKKGEGDVEKRVGADDDE